MSTIVSVKKKDQTAVAWNTDTTADGVATPHASPRPKVRRFADALVGTTGFAVYYPLLNAYCGKNPPVGLNDEDTVFQYFVAFWRELRENYHFVEDQNDRDNPSPFADLDSHFLVVNHSGIYLVRGILSVTHYAEFCAIGSGASHAEGAISALMMYDLSALEIAQRAVEIACMFDTRSTGKVESVIL